MSDAPNFRDYVTSGAFKMSLSRAQVSALSMIAETGEVACGGHTFGALYHKGLVEHIRSKDGRLEYRLTEAGVYALKLARLADLTQGPKDAVEAELRALRKQLNDARVFAQQVTSDAWDMRARLQKAELLLQDARSMLQGQPCPKKPMVTLKDKHPERTVKEMVAHLDLAEFMLSESRDP